MIISYLQHIFLGAVGVTTACIVLVTIVTIAMMARGIWNGLTWHQVWTIYRTSFRDAAKKEIERS